MRKQLVETVEALLDKDPRLVLMLGDIGVFGFRKGFERHPERVYNVGILEQSTVGVAAGLAMDGLIPIVHTIAPFMIERCIEQLKNDFCYQQLGGNFVSVGASYDYAALGCTHHCPGDVGLLKNIPGMEIVLPGTAREFDRLFRETYANGRPTYFRLSERENPEEHEARFGEAVVIQEGSRATIVAVGPVLKAVREAAAGLDVAILYYTTVSPFDAETLRRNCPSRRVLLCEPYYSGALSTEVLRALKPAPVALEWAGVSHEFMRGYGGPEDHDEYTGLTAAHIRRTLEALLGAAAPAGRDA